MKWVTAAQKDIPPGLLEVVGGSELLAQLLARRGIWEADRARAFLHPDFYRPAPPEDLPGMLAGIEVLGEAIRTGERIGVWGDFDVDGQTSTTLLVSALEQLGADVVYHIPVRATESHGINIPQLDRMLSQGIRVLLTCDTGITAHHEIAYSRERGVKVVVTDHHDLPPELPEAAAVINPKMLPVAHPLASLPGVGVAYKLVEGLYSDLSRKGQEAALLDLVALGIVADVALLHGDARFLLQHGLEALRNTPRLGLQIVFELAEVVPEYLSEDDIGFSIGPRLNALGRLGDANVVVEFLTTNREGRARVIASQLEGLNAQRKLLTSQVYQAALAQLERQPELNRFPAMVLLGERWPAGVVGIVAARLAERFGKPTVLLTMGAEGQARGSARSVEGCDISKAIAACQAVLDNFGGHPMAAGVALPVENIDRFRRLLGEQVEEQLGADRVEPTLEIDLSIPLEQVSFSLVEEIERLAPFGPGNPPLCFSSSGLKLLSHSQLGKTGEHIRLIVSDQAGNQVPVVWWGGVGQELPQGVFDLAYSARASTFKGERQLQIELRDFRTVVPPEPEIQAARIDIVDCRGLADPNGRLAELLQLEEEVVVWAEAAGPAEGLGKQREDLSAGGTLVVWTAPPSGPVLKDALKKTQPGKVYFFGIDPGMDDIPQFLTRLSGLCRFAIAKHNGEVSLQRLGGAMSQTQSAVRVGLAWLEAKGHLWVESEAEETITIIPGSPTNRPASSAEAAMENLAYLLQETASFRRYLMGANLETLYSIFSVG